MIIFTEKRSFNEAVLFRFADVFFSIGEIKYYTIRVLKERVKDLAVLNKLKPGEILPHFSLEYKEKKKILVHNQIFGVLKFESNEAANNILKQLNYGEILNGYYRHSDYEFNKPTDDIIPKITSPKDYVESEFSFKVQKFKIGSYIEGFKFNVCFSHRIGNKIYVTDSNLWRGSSYKSFQPNIKVDHVFYELGKKEYFAKNYELAIYYFDATIWFFKEYAHKTLIIGHSLRYKANSLLSLKKHQEAYECYLDPRCVVKNSWDYYNRSEICVSSNNLFSNSLEYLVERKNDLIKFRELLISELKESKSTNFIEKVLSKENDAYYAFIRYYKSFIYESIYSYVILEKYYESYKKILKNEVDSNINGFSVLFTEYWDELYDCISIYTSADDFEDKLMNLSLSVNAQNTNNFIEFTPKKILDKRLGYLESKCKPGYSYLSYWEAKIRWCLFTTNKVRYCDTMYSIRTLKFNSTDHILRLFQESAKIFVFGSHLRFDYDSQFNLLIEDFEGNDLPAPINPINRFIYFEIYDMYYQKGKANFYLKKYALCVEDMNNQIKLFVESYGENNIDTFNKFYYSKSASFFGAKILFEIYFFKSMSELRLKNYKKSYYDLVRALEYYDNFDFETVFLEKLKRMQKSLINKMGFIPTNSEIAEYYYNKAIEIYKLLVIELSSLMGTNDTKGFLCLINKNLSWKLMCNDYVFDKVVSNLRKIIYNLDKHKELKGKNHPRKLHKECTLFFSWLTDQRNDRDRKLKESHDDYSFPRNWGDILGPSEAGVAFWNLD